jgi:hypothetical protein
LLLLFKSAVQLQHQLVLKSTLLLLVSGTVKMGSSYSLLLLVLRPAVELVPRHAQLLLMLLQQHGPAMLLQPRQMQALTSTAA